MIATALLNAICAEGPCDILRAAGTPCVAAHSTTRAMYQAYTGPLCLFFEFLQISLVVFVPYLVPVSD